jgi:hypothetical protein
MCLPLTIESEVNDIPVRIIQGDEMVDRTIVTKSPQKFPYRRRDECPEIAKDFSAIADAGAAGVIFSLHQGRHSGDAGRVGASANDEVDVRCGSIWKVSILDLIVPIAEGFDRSRGSQANKIGFRA